MRTLGAVGRRRENLLACCDIARQRNHGHGGVRHQRRAHALPAPADHVDDTGRKQLGQQRCELQGTERRLLRGLEHHGIAGGERRRQLPGRHQQRVVPRRDRRDHPHRVAADHAGEAGRIFPGNGAVHGAGRPREEAEHIRDGGHLIATHGGQRLAAILRFDRGVFGGLALNAIGEFQEQRGAFLRRRCRPS